MRSHLMAFRSKAAAWLTAGIGSFLALGVAFALGAFEAMPKDTLPKLTAGETMEAGKWRIKPLRLWSTDKKVFSTTPKEGQRALVLEAEVMNRSVKSDSGYATALRLPIEFAAVEQPMVYLMRDETLMPDLQPGMPEKMTYVWLMPADAMPKDRMIFGIEAFQFKYRNNLTGTPGWWNKHIAGTLEMPLAAEQG
ncbi:hypothetical protein M8997_007245 [Phyllobacterium sp. 21LDTY02-6]|uniref:hypothetical protein n=1 Tax=Phyllobacterium sp. 21LDTY02-6 TaxID=2944903 RepID=UPI00202089F9|nr:hypothetical protein [Phyllobacterium sp. 21LDTY02-6]MCO4316973.1 hypothetical protein [Phyllobacterium sp. 21LDTY02-6]